MSLHPVRSRRSPSRRRAQLRARNQWKPWNGWNPRRSWRQFEPSRHKRTLLVIFLFLLALGVYGWSQDPTNRLFHTPVYTGNPDPFTTIWSDTCASCNNNLPGWRVFSGNNGGKVVEKTNCISTTPCIDMGSDSSVTSIALTNATVGDLSLANGKNLAFAVVWQTTASIIGANAEFGYYLTSNATVPTHDIGSSNGYEPKNDPSVVLVQQFACDGSCGAGGSKSIGHSLYFLRTLGRGDTITTEDSGCTGSGSLFLCHDFSLDPNVAGGVTDGTFMNFTGNSPGQGSCTPFGAGCSVYEVTANSVTTSVGFQRIPWFNLQSQQLYLGFYVRQSLGAEVYFLFQDSNGVGMSFQEETFTQTLNPQLDTGGFFGPIIKALVQLGVFILNAILGFVAFITPALQQALGFLQTFLQGLLNFLGNLIWPNSNIGTTFFSLLSDIATFFSNGSYGLPAFFANFPSYFTNFLGWLQISFPFLAPMFTIANGIIQFGIGMVTIGVTVFTVGTQLILFGYGFVLMFAFIVFVADDGVGGVLTYLGTAQALAFKILNIIALLTNLGLDILVTIVSLIPKPFIQASAGKVPRLPTIETSASITFPRFDFAELRNGNIVALWLMTIGIYLDTWFESRNPSLPGSLGSLVPATATAMRTLSSLLPLFQTFVLFSGGICLFYLVMRPVQLVGVDLGIFEEFGLGLGSRQGPGPGRISIGKGKAHLPGFVKERTRHSGVVASIPKEEHPEENIN